MGSTSAFAEDYNPLTPMDIQAFDVIGWDVVASTQVPEPATMVLFGAGLITFVGLGMKKGKFCF